MTENRYCVRCLFCKSDQSLYMFPQRILGEMVGWVFICKDCYAAGKNTNVEIELKPLEQP